MKKELSFDGFGINLPDEYRTRLATFERIHSRETVDKYGKLFAAAPELLEAVDLLTRYLKEVGYGDMPVVKNSRAILDRVWK
jgi:hypothetical protein